MSLMRKIINQEVFTVISNPDFMHCQSTNRRSAVYPHVYYSDRKLYVYLGKSIINPQLFQPRQMFLGCPEGFFVCELPGG